MLFLYILSVFEKTNSFQFKYKLRWSIYKIRILCLNLIFFFFSKPIRWNHQNYRPVSCYLYSSWGYSTSNQQHQHLPLNVLWFAMNSGQSVVTVLKVLATGKVVMKTRSYALTHVTIKTISAAISIKWGDVLIFHYKAL